MTHRRGFPTTHLTVEQKRDICRRAHERCRRWRVDVLDCTVSFHREPVTVPFDVMLEKLDEGCHFVIIHRFLEGIENHIDVGFSTFSEGPLYFLWLELDPSYCDRLEEVGYVPPPQP